MVNWIKLGGKERPLSVGYEVAKTYEIKTGGNYNAIVVQFVREVRAAAGLFDNNTPIEEVGLSFLSALSVTPISSLVYYGLLHGHRREGLNVDFSEDDVIYWIFEDHEALAECIKVLSESLIQRKAGEQGESDETKKKPETAYPKSTGKTLSKRQR
jgi:hypothetical protein